MSSETALERTPYQSSDAFLQQAPPAQQGLVPQVVPLDRETLSFYGNMIQAANLVPPENGVSQEVAKYRVMAKIVAGVSYGFDPVLSQQCFDVLFNRMGMNAHGMEILFRDSGEYDTRIKQLDDAACVVTVLKQEGGTWNDARGRFEGGKWVVIGDVKFTYEMAKQAGLDKKNALWQGGYRQDMLYSKVMKRVTKRFNPTCLRPRTLLGNYFAKQAPAQIETASVPTPPQLTAEGGDLPKIQDTQEWVDPTYAGGGDDDGAEAVIEFAGPQGEPNTATAPAPEPTKLADIQTLLDLKMNTPGDVQKFLKGRDLASADDATLTAILEELKAL